jgi:hypothetical protein
VIEIINDSSMNSERITRQIESSLEWIPIADLEGLKYIRCLDQINLQDQKVRNWQQKVNPQGYDVCGMYYRESGVFPAHVEVYVGTTYRSIPKVLMYSPIPVFLLTRILAHEVGHHIAARGVASSFLNFKFSGKFDEEEFADEYALRLQGCMLRSLRFRVARWGVRTIAARLVDMGVFYLGRKQYQRATACFYKAMVLDRTYADANHYYWYAKALVDRR